MPILADSSTFTVPTCLACGACCFSRLPRYVRVSGADYARLGERAEALTVFDGHRAYMRMVDGHCTALRVDGSRAEFRCDAYDVRPDVCRELERLSPSCDAERFQKADRALVVLRRSR